MKHDRKRLDLVYLKQKHLLFLFFFKGVISGDNSNVLLKNKYRSKTGPSLGTVPLKA